MTASQAIPVAAQAFDTLADCYDSVFTHSLIGRAQRDAVRRIALQVFRPAQRILELNCGTGEDALFFAEHGMNVLACDASPKMIGVAEQKHQRTLLPQLQFRCLATENLQTLYTQRFDGIFSNFSGLNCVNDLAGAVRSLSFLTYAGSRVLICVSTRLCVWELIYYGMRLEFSRALRRLPGRTTAQVGPYPVPVYYPNARRWRSLFSPFFRLRNIFGIGVFVPPSYLERWVQHNRQLFEFLRQLDRRLLGVPLLRVLGDHVLFDFERTA